MAIGFRTPIRKSPTKIEGSARLPRMLCSAAAEQKQAQKSARHPGKSLCLFYLFGQERIQRAGAGWIATAWTGGVSRGHSPFGSGFPIGAGSTPVGTRFCSAKSSVLYLCFRLTRERGWLRHLLYGQIAVDRHFSAAVGQADFVTPR